VGIWLGCAKIGVVPALINTNLTGRALVHSVNTASAIACIYGAELAKSELVLLLAAILWVQCNACMSFNGLRKSFFSLFMLAEDTLKRSKDQ
jgi:hypothetical protein